MRVAKDVTVKGIVQGVGFRPFVYRIAHECGLTGWVLNDVAGVSIHAEGEEEAIDRFVILLSESAPAAAQVKEIDIAEGQLADYDTFEIHFSEDADASRATLVSPDLATCDECIAELFDPADRRYRYPFINCTNCGPRFTIIDSLPYDRPKTSMRTFKMCPTCEAEYKDPADRRFHAQPDACFECGPHLGWMEAGNLPKDAAAGVEEIEWAHDRETSDALIARAVALLHEGGIVAVKGLGGYHLACDASNARAIACLRKRKRRDGKALAVMVAGVDDARAVCHVSVEEQAQLESPARPIVLLRKRSDAALVKGLADKLPELGVMLPATPVQHLLLRDFGGMLVMTSGNIHDEPIVTDEASAFGRLRDVADAFLVNDRPILNRYDDSVLRVLNGGDAGAVVQFMRRARGYAPQPITLQAPNDAPLVFATGPEQKVTFTFARPGEAFTSQHIGDLESTATYDAWLEAKASYERTLRLTPSVVACDMHPEYLSSKWAHSQDLPVVEVQHHHAHLLSVMAENQLGGPVCGFAFDGTGYGMDGAIWGGEVMIANLSAFERFANVAYFPLPGGAAAVKHPDRAAFGLLWSLDLLDHPAASRLLERLGSDAQLLEQMAERGLNAPLTSSMGRLFDAASALLGVCSEPTYQGEAAILLEAAVHKGLADGEIAAWEAAKGAAGMLRDGELPSFSILKNTATENSTAQDTSVLLLDPEPLFAGLMDGMEAGVPVCVLAKRFHDAVVEAIVQCAELSRALYGIATVACSGGVFCNRYLVERVLDVLPRAGFTVALGRELPPSDACVSHGQAVLALHAQTLR